MKFQATHQEDRGHSSTLHVNPIPHHVGWPPPLAEAAYYGLAGKFARAVEPHTEADPVALLGQFLVASGNIIDRSVCFRVEATTHYLNLFKCLVGDTAKARKGTSLDHTINVAKAADFTWVTRIMSGLSSGEGLIWVVRNPIIKKEAIRDQKTRKFTGEYEEVEFDQGVSDKRLLVVEPEFASVLRLLNREGNILSTVMRQAWDGDDLRTLVKNSPAVATGAHISVIGHITQDELRRHLTESDAASGFGNRFLWLLVRRSKSLPRGGKIHEVDFGPIIKELQASIAFARSMGEIDFDADADGIWREVYPQLSEGKPGLVGALTARAEAQVMRLAAIYAVLDRSRLIREEHLLAALALWDYAEASASKIFGRALGNPIADTILGALQNAPEGLTRTEIHYLFGRNISAERIQTALQLLLRNNFVFVIKVETNGRPTEIWRAATKSQS